MSRLTMGAKLLSVAPFVALVACSSSGPGDGSSARLSAHPAKPSESTLTAPPPRTSVSTLVGPTAPSPTTSYEIRTADYNGVVLVVKSARELGVRAIDKVPTDDVAWTPTQEDIAAFEAGLGPYLDSHVPTWAKDLPKNYHSYKRQWMGVSAGGKRKIYGNFFCREMPGWKDQIVMVDDGGDCYFQIFYNVDSRTYVDLMINGMG